MAKKIILSTEVIAANIVAKADYLVKQREDFEQNEYARSNKRLYEILAEVLDMYEHSYQMDYGATAGSYIDAFFRNIQWSVVAYRLDKAREIRALVSY